MNYEHKLEQLGRMLDGRLMRDICVAEVPGGLLVTGLADSREREDQRWRAISFEVMDEQLETTQATPAKRRWPF